MKIINSEELEFIRKSLPIFYTDSVLNRFSDCEISSSLLDEEADAIRINFYNYRTAKALSIIVPNDILISYRRKIKFNKII